MGKMTLHRALAELKLIDSKIEKQISELIASGVKQKGKPVGGIMDETEFTKLANSRVDSTLALIDRKVIIKSAVVKANSETLVSVAGKSMTIAEAINFKSTVALKKRFISMLKSSHSTTLAHLNKNNEAVEANIQRILEATFGKENVKVTESDMEAVRKPYMDANEFKLVDPLKVDALIEKLEKEVGDFEMEVDASLSEINAVTFIEI